MRKRALIVLALWLFGSSPAFAQAVPDVAAIPQAPGSNKSVVVDAVQEPCPGGCTPVSERVSREPRRVATPDVYRATMIATPGTPQRAIRMTQTPGGPTATPTPTVRVIGWCKLCNCPSEDSSLFWDTDATVTVTSGEELLIGQCVTDIPATDYSCSSVNIVASDVQHCYTLTATP